MRSPFLAFALLAATVVSAAKQAPSSLVKPRLPSSKIVRTSSSALDVTSVAGVDSINNALVTTRGGDEDSSSGLLVRLKIGGYFGLWYILNVYYNSELILLQFGYIIS